MYLFFLNKRMTKFNRIFLIIEGGEIINRIYYMKNYFQYKENFFEN